jgi:oxygen-independent coproporphyrinogen-3 oxidase
VQSVASPEDYAAAIETEHSVIARGHRLDAEDKLRKFIINDLMCNLRIQPEEVLAGVETSLAESLLDAMDRLEPFEADGLIERERDGYRITELGQLFVRNLAMPFDGYLRSQQTAAFSRTV